MNKTRHIGFTGTREGMSEFQKERFRNIIRVAVSLGGVVFHHGDCVGADAEAHEIAQSENVTAIIIHPPTIDSHRAFCGMGESNVTWFPPFPYLKRDKMIVDNTKILIAAPKSDIEELRSGTWATIRHARKTNVNHIVMKRNRISQSK